MGKGCPALPVPNVTVGTHPALPPCWFLSQGMSAMPTSSCGLFGSTEVIHPCGSLCSRESDHHPPLHGMPTRLVYLLPLAQQAHPQALQQQKHHMCLTRTEHSWCPLARVLDCGTVWDHICVISHSTTEMGRNCANGKQICLPLLYHGVLWACPAAPCVRGSGVDWCQSKGSGLAVSPPSCLHAHQI